MESGAMRTGTQQRAQSRASAAAWCLISNLGQPQETIIGEVVEPVELVARPHRHSGAGLAGLGFC